MAQSYKGICAKVQKTGGKSSKKSYYTIFLGNAVLKLISGEKLNRL